MKSIDQIKSPLRKEELIYTIETLKQRKEKVS